MGKSDETASKFKHPVLIVIDMQNDFCHPDGWVAKHGGSVTLSKAAIGKVKQLTDWARTKNMPIIYTAIELTEKTGGIFFELRPIYREGGIREGTWGADLVDELKPQPKDYIIKKRRFSAFIGTDLEILLRGLGADVLLFCGVATHLCVESTIRDAAQKDFHVILVGDCAASYDLEFHKASERAIAAGFGKVLSFSDTRKLFINR